MGMQKQITPGRQLLFWPTNAVFNENTADTLHVGMKKDSF
jgi:hypothetical protein